MENNTQKLKTLSYLLGAYYHEDVWVDFPTHNHRAVWESFLARDQNNVDSLSVDIQTLLTWSPQAQWSYYRNMVNEGAHGISFSNNEELVDWLQELSSFLKSSVA